MKLIKLSIDKIPFLLLIGIILSFSFAEKSSESKEILTIISEFGTDYQRVYISNSENEFRKIAIVNPNSKNKVDQMTRKNLLKNGKVDGFEIIKKKLSSEFDSRLVLKLIKEYEDNGWILKSSNLDNQKVFYQFEK